MRKTESVFLRTIKGRIYLVHRSRDADGRRHDQATPLSSIEHKTLQTALQIKEQIQSEIVEVPCMNPRCKNKVRMTRRQLEEFLVSAKKRYDMVILPFCSPECRDEALARHGGKTNDP
ncbi:MAG: hypothetical protein WC277_12415 [Bacilli bacterium]